jgi:hypothetical protein
MQRRRGGLIFVQGTALRVFAFFASHLHTPAHATERSAGAGVRSHAVQAQVLR